jgi:hypothetical protein
MAIELRDGKYCIEGSDRCFSTRAEAEAADRQDSADRVERFDVIGGLNFETTPQGFLRARANLTRTGVLKYTQPDGTVIRELRPPAEVSRHDSLGSLQHAPITDLHPGTMVNPANVDKYGIGVVASANMAGRFVKGEIIVQRQDAISKIREGKLRELSPGYSCRIEKAAGEHNGEAYDQIQRDIVYNHLAIGPESWGRSGPEVSIRTDGGDETRKTTYHVLRADDAGDQTPNQEPRKMETRTLRIDGVDCEIEIKASQIVERELERRADAAEAAEKRADAAEAERDALQGKLDETAKARDEIQAKLDHETSAEALAAKVAARVALESQAHKVLGREAKLDGLSDREIKVKAIQAAAADFDPADRSDGYIDGRFEALAEAAPGRNDGVKKVGKAFAKAAGSEDGQPAERVDSDQAEANLNKRLETRYLGDGAAN